MSILKVAAIQNAAGVEVYTAKAWVNFTGGGTVGILASGNVSSITDNGVGDYTVNFTSAMVDTKYATVVTADRTSQSGFWSNPTVYSAGFTRVLCAYAISGSSTFNVGDPNNVHVAIFR